MAALCVNKYICVVGSQVSVPFLGVKHLAAAGLGMMERSVLVFLYIRLHSWRRELSWVNFVRHANASG